MNVAEGFAEADANDERRALKAKWQQAFFDRTFAKQHKTRLAALDRVLVWTVMLVGCALCWSAVFRGCR